MPPGKRDEVRDEDGLITEVIKALRQLRKYWLQTGDYVRFPPHCLMMRSRRIVSEVAHTTRSDGGQRGGCRVRSLARRWCD